MIQEFRELQSSQGVRNPEKEVDGIDQIEEEEALLQRTSSRIILLGVLALSQRDIVLLLKKCHRKIELELQRLEPRKLQCCLCWMTPPPPFLKTPVERYPFAVTCICGIGFRWVERSGFNCVEMLLIMSNRIGEKKDFPS